MIYFLFLILIFNSFVEANHLHTNSSHIISKRQGFLPIFGELISAIFGSGSLKCAIYEGPGGTCIRPSQNCPNLRDGTRTSCVIGLSSNGICCPNSTFIRPVVPPPASIPCGVTNSDGRKSRKETIGYKQGSGIDSESELESEMESESEPELKSQYFIVGGKESTPGSWPWIVQIMFKASSTKNHSYICCGSIINDQYVLSAAHCVLSLNPNDFRIKIGATTLKNDGEVVEVEKIIVHEAYTSLRHQNDLSLFKLKQRINWNNNKNVAPVCLPTPDMASMDLTGQLTWLIGWGTTSSGGKVSQDLLEVQVPIITNPKCATAYDSIFSGPDRISERQMCAGYDEGGKDSCQGDSGGPLMMKIKGRIYQLGVVSYGNGCARAGYPGVYTKVSWFSYWIGYQIARESRLYTSEGEE